MSKIPIDIIKYTEESLYGGSKIKFQIVTTDKSQTWERCYSCDLNELTKFRDEISAIIDTLTWNQKVGIDNAMAAKIDNANGTDEICSSCNSQKTKKCITCLTELQSPLERKLYSKLIDEKLHFEVQYPISVFGKKAAINNLEEKDLRLKYKDLLTQVDFFLPNGGNPICVYTDGHNYHERTPDQAKRDRSIDRKLQEFNFVVFRFTGREINENLSMVVKQIMAMAEKKN